MPKAAGRVFFGDPQSHLPLLDERVCSSQAGWIIVTNTGWDILLTVGSVGVHFNDSTSLVLSPDKV